MRLAIAFLVAPLATPFAIWLTFSAAWLLQADLAHQPYQLVVINTTGVSRLATPIAAVVTLVGAVPAYWLFRRMRWLGLKHFLALGVILGWAPFGLAALVRPLEARFWLPLSLLGITCGLASASVFWLIGVAPHWSEPVPERSRRGAA